jgi:hypothetical protein
MLLAVMALILSGLVVVTLPAPASAISMEPNIDRPGGDIADFDLPEPRPEVCQLRCADRGDCQAYTYVNPGVQHPRLARCWLKNTVPPPVPSTCCTSGVKNPSIGGPIIDEPTLKSVTVTFDTLVDGKDHDSFLTIALVSNDVVGGGQRVVARADGTFGEFPEESLREIPLQIKGLVRMSEYKNLILKLRFRPNGRDTWRFSLGWLLSSPMARSSSRT